MIKCQFDRLKLRFNEETVLDLLDDTELMSDMRIDLDFINWNQNEPV